MKSKLIRFLSFAAFIGVLFIAINMMSCANLNSETERNKEIVINALKTIQDKLYNELNQYYAENFVRHCQATPGVVVDSLEDFKALLRNWDKTFTDIEYQTQAIIAEGDLVAFYCSFSATQTGQMGPFPPTGKRMSAECAGYHRIANEKIVETWVTWDNMATLQQLGLSPPPSEEANSNR